MATCRKCIHWDKCSKADGTTRFYGKEVACNDAEKLCEWFISTIEVAPIADTVRKMQERLRFEIINEPSVFRASQGTVDFLTGSAHRQSEILEIVDRIAKEMIGADD